jgi:hypothetical protein
MGAVGAPSLQGDGDARAGLPSGCQAPGPGFQPYSRRTECDTVEGYEGNTGPSG